MKVWVVKTGELLPTDGDNSRLLRSGILSHHLAAAGHDVTWWTSAWNHQLKEFRSNGFSEQRLDERQRILLLPSIGYKGNVSVRRLVEHRLTARAFLRYAAQEPLPDVIHCAFPTIDLAVATVAFGRKHGIPVFVDVRDLWPDIFEEQLPGPLHAIGPVIFSPLRRATQRAFRGATGVLGSSPGFVEWGLRQAGRDRSEFDGDFPLAFFSAAPPASALRTAEDELRAAGILGWDGFTVFFAGTLSSRLELPTVVEAARHLSATADRIRVVLAGDGPMMAGLKALAEGLPNLYLTGWIDRARMTVLTEHSDVGLVPYPDRPDFLGNVPNKAVEYLAAGLPIVTSLQGELGNLLARSGAGMTYPNRDAEGLAALVRSLASDPGHCADMSAAAKIVFDREFDSHIVYREMISLLERSVAKAVL